MYFDVIFEPILAPNCYDYMFVRQAVSYVYKKVSSLPIHVSDKISGRVNQKMLEDLSDSNAMCLYVCFWKSQVR